MYKYIHKNIIIIISKPKLKTKMYQDHKILKLTITLMPSTAHKKHNGVFRERFFGEGLVSGFGINYFIWVPSLTFLET